LYICGDAKRMTKDVERALVDIVAQFGARTTDEAVSFVAEEEGCISLTNLGSGWVNSGRIKFSPGFGRENFSLGTGSVEVLVSLFLAQA
jgi:hypothetical protein